MSRSTKRFGVRNEILRARRLSTAVVEALEERRLLSGTIPGGYTLIQTLTPTDLDAGNASTILKNGTTYYLRVTGFAERSDHKLEDAEYFDFSGTRADTVMGNSSADDDIGVKTSDVGDVPVRSPTWGSYDADHVYVTSFLGSGNAEHFVFVPPDTPPFHFALPWTSTLRLEIYGVVPANVPPADSGGITDTAFGANGGQDGSEAISESGVRFADGTTTVSATDLSSSGLGSDWGVTRSWTNAPGVSPTSNFGNGWVISQMPYMQLVTGTSTNPETVAVMTGGSTAHYFSYDGSHFTSNTFDAAKLTWGSSQFTFTDSTGTRIVFDDFTNATSQRQGQFSEKVDAAGNITDIPTSGGYDGSGRILKINRKDSSSTIVETYVYSYVPSGSNAGKVASVTLQRPGPTTVRSATYDYYDTGDSNGLLGDLKTVTIKDAGAATIDTYYYRYYVSTGSGALSHGIRMFFNPRSYARLASAIGSQATIDSTADASVDDYADHSYTYDSNGRVATDKAAGFGNGSSSPAGVGTFSFAYSDSAFAAGYNSWLTKTIETKPDSSTNTVYSNAYGQPMLTVSTPDGTSDEYSHFTEYDDSGRVLLKAEPSAMDPLYSTTDYELCADLMHAMAGNYDYIEDGGGLISRYEYGATADVTTSASTTRDGYVDGYLTDVRVSHGESDAGIKTAEWTYREHTDANSTDIFVPASYTTFPNGTTDPRPTNYSYTWQTIGGNLTNRVATQTIYAPGITSAMNGPYGGSGLTNRDAKQITFDAYGRATSTTDGDGYVNNYTFDNASGALTQQVVDAAGLALTTNYGFDALGRTTSITTPGSKVTRILYNDAAHETEVFPGFTGSGSSGSTTGPIKVIREYRASSGSGGALYYEVLTTSASPTVSGGLPTGIGTISSSNIQSLDRKVTNAAGQIAHDDRYFTLSGLTYSQSDTVLQTTGGSPVDATASNDTASGHYHKSTYGYDGRGRLNHLVAPTGTITNTIFDDLGRTTTVKVGTDDSGTGSDNMTAVVDYEYDGGGVGDSNITEIISHVASGTDRINDLYYDFRDRLTSEKDGIEISEAADVNRPIFTYEYNDLSEVTAVNRYDGDSQSPTSPSSSKLRARSIMNYDEQGRVSESGTISVTQSGGGAGGFSDSTGLFTNTYFDHRGNVIEVSNPGGQVNKYTFDGADRLSKSYVSDGSTGTSWSNAASVSGDYVLTQSEMTYDSDSNLSLLVTRDRFHNAANAGALLNPASGTTLGARVSYQEFFYDGANRLAETVNLGTIGGSSYSADTYPTTPSSTKLVTDYSYNSAGRLSSVTDPRSIISTTSYDLLGRTTETIAAYTGSGPTVNTDQTTDYTYDGDDHVLTAQAVLLGPTHQTTAYIYGTTIAGGSDIASNDLLAKIEYPIKSGTGVGDPSTSSSNNVTFKYDALGEAKNMTDRNGSIHAYSHDVLGRLTLDNVTTLGSGLDGTVRKLGYTYSEAGLPESFTSYDSVGSVVNDVKRVYNGLGQLYLEYQEHDPAAVNTGTTPYVQYVYSTDDNNSRLVSMTYPDGRVLEYKYTSGSGSSGIDSRISRVSYLDWSSASSTHLEEYKYLGLGTVVEFAHPEIFLASGSPTVHPVLTYMATDSLAGSDGGDQYTGLDRFGRIIDQDYTDGTNVADRFQYKYDENSNALFRSNLLDHTFDELYHTNGASNGYDKLNRITEFSRGTLSDANSDGTLDTVTSSSRNQAWTLDALGNWTSGTNISPSTRTHNAQNQLTNTNYTYDNNGNETHAGSSVAAYKYDAWNRMIRYNATSLASSSDTFAYDALGRRITEYLGSSTAVIQSTNHLYYSAAWQVILEQTVTTNEEGIVGGGGDDEEMSFTPMSLTATGVTNRYENVWSPVYVDAMVLRDKDAAADGTYEERKYVQHDANFNTTALIGYNGTQWEVQERYIYDPYGAVTFKTGAWGSRGSSSYAWKYDWQGLRYDSASNLYDMRTRVTNPTLGRPMQPDRAGFADGMNMFQLERSNSISLVDPLGLSADSPIPTLPTGTPTTQPISIVIGSIGSKEPPQGWEGEKFAPPKHTPEQEKKIEDIRRAVLEDATRRSDIWEPVGTIAGKINNLPNTIIGIIVGVLGGGHWQEHDGIIEITDAGWMPSAITIGEVTIYGPRLQPTDPPNEPHSPTSTKTARDHERAHVPQGRILGPLYIPVQIISKIIGIILDGRHHGEHDIMETGPQDDPAHPWPGKSAQTNSATGK